MTRRRQTLHLGLADPEAADAQRVLLFRLLQSTAQELRTRMDRQLAESGLTTQQAMLLHRLQGEPEPPTLKAFAERLAMSHQNLKQIALALERKGFVEFVADAEDGRLRRLQLTPKHHRFWARRNVDDHAEVVRWTAALSDAEVRGLVKGLDTLHAALMAARDAG